MLDLHRYKAGNYTHNHGIWANVCKRGRKGDVRGMHHPYQTCFYVRLEFITIHCLRCSYIAYTYSPKMFKNYLRLQNISAYHLIYPVHCRIRKLTR